MDQQGRNGSDLLLDEELTWKLSGSTSRELKDALDIQGGGLEQHWVFESRVSWIRKPDHSCVTRAEREYPNRVEIRGREFVIQEGTSGDVGVNSGKVQRDA